ncbi:MAG: signal recognition particle receptor subunit alpha, partial [Actinomycetia bacterium]|nr:signal recognition particle receptor subunit alpha [Actinomycetes bacterium]
MFDNLSRRLQEVFSSLSSKGRLSEDDVDGALRQIRLALLEADVNLQVAKDFIAELRQRAVGADIMSSLTPGQMVIKLVLDQLTELLGTSATQLTLSNRIPNVIMLVGLQGSGKTTAAAKLALHLRKKGRKPQLVAADVYRPAAIDQLQTLGRELQVPVFVGKGDIATDPIAIAKAGVKEAIDAMRDLVIIDTAGRLQIDETMMQEAEAIKKATRPDQIIMVLDAMTGQEAVNVAQAFSQRLDFDGVLLSKLDGD